MSKSVWLDLPAAPARLTSHIISAISFYQQQQSSQIIGSHRHHFVHTVSMNPILDLSICAKILRLDFSASVGGIMMLTLLSTIVLWQEWTIAKINKKSWGKGDTDLEVAVKNIVQITRNANSKYF